MVLFSHVPLGYVLEIVRVLMVFSLDSTDRPAQFMSIAVVLAGHMGQSTTLVRFCLLPRQIFININHLSYGDSDVKFEIKFGYFEQCGKALNK